MKLVAAFWSELKRRRVPQVAGIYLAGGFAVAQAADLFFPRLGLPDWTVTGVVFVVVAGFPIAVLLAWLFDIVPETSSDVDDNAQVRPRMRAAAPIMASVLLVALAAAFVTVRKSSSGLVRTRVAVAAFENRSGVAALDAIGSMTADWIAEGLARSAMVDVVPPQVARATALGIAARMTTADGATRAFTLAREASAGTLIWGAYYRDGDWLQLQGEITDVANGKLIRKLEPVIVPIDSASAGIALLAHRTAGALAARLNPRLSGWSDAVRPPSLPAYDVYAQGLEKYITSLDTRGYREAAALFERAVHLDSSFVVASLWLAQALANGIDRQRADSIAAALERRPERLTPYDRAFLDRLQARLRGDWRAAYAAATRMTEIAPSSDDAWRERALDALRLNRLNEGLRIFNSLDPNRGWLRGWPHFYHWQLEGNHLLGKHERELELAHRAVRHYPNVEWLAIAPSIARAALGDAVDVTAVMAKAATAASPWAPLTFALELNAHKHPQATEALRQAVAWHRRWASVDTTLAAQLDLVEALYYGGHHDEAEALAQKHAPHAKGTAAAVIRGVLGAIAARRGDREQAAAYSRELAAMQSLATGTRNTSWRARIAAQLGDRQDAVRLLEQAFTEGMMPIRSTSGGVFAPLHVMPELLHLRGYAPFDRLLHSSD